MNLKGIMQTLGAKPGQVVSNPYARAFVPQPTITEAEGEDHEVSMANNSLDTIIKMATELKAKMGENEKDIPAWIQDHITNSENFISQASSNYHEYSTNEAGINGADRYPTLNAEAVELPTTALPSTVKSKLTIAIDTIKDAELTYNQKVQVVKQVTDSLGIDKTEFNKIASRLKGTMESVNEASYTVKADNAYQFINGADRYPTLNAESVNEEVKDWDVVYNVFVKFLKANTKELEKRVLSKDEDATKKAIKSIVSGLTNAQRSLKMEAVEIPVTALPSTVKSKLMIAIDTIKDAELTYNQKVQVVKQVTDSLGIDKTEFNKIASRLKGTMESVNESAEILKPGTKVKLRGGKTGKVVRYDGKTPGSPFYIVDIGQYYSIEVPADEIKTESVNTSLRLTKLK